MIAGYNVVIVESVGLGQSEVEIDNAVDMLVMIVPPGGGDGLQVRHTHALETHLLFFIFISIFIEGMCALETFTSCDSRFVVIEIFVKCRLSHAL